MNNYSSFQNRYETIRKILNEDKNDAKDSSSYKRNTDPNKFSNRSQSQRSKGGSKSGNMNERINIDDYINYNSKKQEDNAEKVILDESLGFSNYINVLNSFRNPDIITGDATKFLKGNKYRAKVANKVSIDQNDIQNTQDVEMQNDKTNEQEVESEEESDSEPEIPTRYYHKDSKAIICRNCKEVGHLERN